MQEQNNLKKKKGKNVTILLTLIDLPLNEHLTFYLKLWEFQLFMCIYLVGT